VAAALEPHKRHRGFFEVTIMPRAERETFTSEDSFDGLIGFSLRTSQDGPATADFREEKPPRRDSVAAGQDWAEFVLPAQSYLTFRYSGDNTIATLSRLYSHVFSTGLLNRRESLGSDAFFHYYPSGQIPGGGGQTSIRFFLPLAPGEVSRSLWVAPGRPAR
jgi:hypothetical protein